MTTHIIFWNPDISSYTKERFLDDYNEKESVGNWSFYEHEKVKKGDIFFMIKCGGGKTGIVMRGEVFSDCYKDVDWSPKNRPDIYYADIIPCVCINPWSDATLLSPDELTAEMPDFNWYGGHSGRKLDDTYARKLEHMWFQYLATKMHGLATSILMKQSQKLNPRSSSYPMAVAAKFADTHTQKFSAKKSALL